MDNNKVPCGAQVFAFILLAVVFYLIMGSEFLLWISMPFVAIFVIGFIIFLSSGSKKNKKEKEERAAQTNEHRNKQEEKAYRKQKEREAIVAHQANEHTRMPISEPIDTNTGARPLPTIKNEIPVPTPVIPPASIEIRRKKPTRTLESISIPEYEIVELKGLHFRDPEAKQFASTLKPGDKLYMQPQSSNIHDHFAVAIKSINSLHLGFVPREKSKFYSDLLREGNRGDCTVYQVGRMYDGEPFVKMKIKVIGIMREIHYINTWPCEAEKWCLEMSSYGGYKYDFWAQSFGRMPEHSGEAEALKSRLKEMSAETLIPYLIANDETPMYRCYCESCRWIRVGNLAVKRISFDEYKVSLQKIDKKNKQEKHCCILRVACKAHALIDEGGEQEARGMIDEALQLYNGSFSYLSDIDYIFLASERMRILYTSGYLADRALESQVMAMTKIENDYALLLEDGYILNVYNKIKAYRDKLTEKVRQENDTDIKKRLAKTKQNLRSVEKLLTEEVHDSAESRLNLLAWKIINCEKKIERLNDMIKETN